MNEHTRISAPYTFAANGAKLPDVVAFTRRDPAFVYVNIHIDQNFV